MTQLRDWFDERAPSRAEGNDQAKFRPVIASNFGEALVSENDQPPQATLSTPRVDRLWTKARSLHSHASESPTIKKDDNITSLLDLYLYTAGLLTHPQ